MSVNPFVSRRPTDPSKPSLMDDFFSKTGPPSISSLDPSRKGKITPKQQNINSNLGQPPKIAPKSIQTKLLIFDMFQQHQARNTATSHIPPHNKKLNLEARVLNTQCDIAKLNQISKLGDVQSQNIKIYCLRSTKYLSDKVQKSKKIASCFAQLFGTIRLSNQKLLNRMNSRKGQPLDFLFTSQETNRLLQGLLFYKPKNNKHLHLLSKAMQRHVLGEQTKYIAQTFNLDILRAYYVVKEVYVDQNILPAHLKSFEAELQKNQLIDRQKLTDLAGQFLKEDKKNLLLIYGKYLYGQRKPSKFNICRVDEEIKLIWANIHMMKQQNPEIQEMVFKIFLKYSDFEHAERYVYVQIQAMKRSFTQMNQIFNEQITEISMEKMLKEGNFNEKQCKDHYLDLVNFLINRQPIDFESAIRNLSKISNLHQKWMDYFRLYIRQVQFDEGKTKQIMKAVYIYKIAKILYAKNCSLQQGLQHKLVKQVYNKCSIILGLKFLTIMTSKSLKIWSLNFLLKFTQKDIQRMQDQDSYILQKLLPEDYTCGGTVPIIIDLIESTFRSFIESEDLTMLETMISSGRNLTFSFVSSEQFQLQTLKYYTRVFYKFPSEQPKIQANINQLFKTLKKQNVNIEFSLNLYNNNLLSQLRKPELIGKHLIFMLEILQSAEKRVGLLQRWLNVVEKEQLHQEFQWFYQVLDKIAKNIQNNASINLVMDIINKVLDLFKQSILNFIANLKYDQARTKIFSLLLTFTQIGDWFSLLEHTQTHQLSFFKKEIKAQIQLTIKSPIDILSYPELPMTKKLFILSYLTNSQDNQLYSPHFTRCLLSDLLTKDKSTTIPQLYKMISSELKKESDLQPLFALYHVTQLEQYLAKMLIQQNAIQLVSSLSCQSQTSLLNTQKVVKLATKLHTYLPNSLPHQRQKINLLFRFIQDRVFIWLKKSIMTVQFFRSLFDLISMAKNAIPFQYHMVYLSTAKNNQYFAQLSHAQYKKLGIYGLYLLSLRLSKESSAVQINDQQQRKQLILEIQVFTQIQLNLLTHFTSCQSREFFDEICYKYFSKLTKVLAQCSKQPYINQIAIKLLSKLKTALSNSSKVFSTDNFIKRQLSLVQQYLQVNSNSTLNCYTPYCPLQLLRCSNHKDFNQLLLKNLSQLSNKHEKQLLDIQVSKIISFIDNNSQFKIDFVGISTKIRNLSSFNLLFISLLHKIISQLNPQHYAKRNNKHITKQIISHFKVQSADLSHLQHICQVRQFLELINKILATGLLSSFQVSERFSLNIKEMLQSLREILFRWSSCNTPSLKVLDQFSLILNHYPFGTNYHKVFTLWNLLQYRQKLLLVDQILKYCREVNGLLDFKKYGLIQIIIEYTSFLTLNEAYLSSKQSEEKISAINKLLKGSSLNPSNLMNFIEKDFSISQLKQATWRIVQQLNYLNFEQSSFEVQFFEYFNPETHYQ